MNFSHGADGRARVLRRRLLFDGNRRRQAIDLIDVRLLHHFQELAGIGGQGFHIPPLTLGINRVERQRGFAGSGKASQHHQLIAGDFETDVLEIVLARNRE